MVLERYLELDVKALLRARASFTFASSKAAAECVKNGAVEIGGKSYNVEMARPSGGYRGGRGREGRGGGFSPRGGRGSRGGDKSFNWNRNKLLFFVP